MKKIPTMYVRVETANRYVINEIVPGCEWVKGVALATVKIDGTCCMIRDNKLYRRYELKNGKTGPLNFEPAQDSDPFTGDIPGWIPVGDGPEDQYHRAAMPAGVIYPDGTYELIGPKVQGNI